MPDRVETSLQTLAFDRIREDIVFCRLKPGQKVSARMLEEQLGLGRTPVREALVRLGEQGLVYTIPQSGTFISKINLHAAENARYVREHLERSVTVECCARLTNDDITLLENLLDQQIRAFSGDDATVFFKSDNHFHEELFRIAGREEIWSWIQTQNTHLERFRWLRTQAASLDWREILQQHRQLFQALAERNPEEAEYLTARHLHLMTTEQDAVLDAFPDYFDL